MKVNNKFYIFSFSFLIRVCFYTPIFAAFLSNTHNFTNSQITMLFAIFSIATFIFEIPTGIVSDVLGEKVSLIVASFLTGISTVLFLQSNIYFVFLAEILLGISSTFISGTFESLLYKYCNRTPEIDCAQFISRAYSLQWIALIISFIGCSILMNFIDLINLFWVTFIFNLIAIIISFKLPNTSQKEKQKSKSLISSCLKQIISEKNLKIIFMYNLSIKAILISGYQIFQPYLSELKYDSDYNGIIYFLGALIASMGSEIFGKLSSKKSSKWILFFCSIILSIAMFGFSISYKNIVLLAFLLCLYRFAWGLSTPLLVVLSNKQLKNDDFRNTFFSIISLFTNLVVGLILFSFGIIKIHTSFNYGILAFFMVIFLIFIYLSWNKELEN